MGVHSSEAQKQAALEKWLNSGLPLRTFAAQEGIPRATFFCWKKKYLRKEVRVSRKTKPEQHTPEQKFSIVLQTSTMSELELGAYCREHGLFSDQISDWKDACIQGNARPQKTQRSTLSSKIDKKKIKKLEKELNRKEKALAETAALLVLRKKFNALWEESEDE